MFKNNLFNYKINFMYQNKKKFTNHQAKKN